MVLSKMNNHEHQTKQTYESYTFQPLMSFCINVYEICPEMHAIAISAIQIRHFCQNQQFLQNRHSPRGHFPRPIWITSPLSIFWHFRHCIHLIENIQALLYSGKVHSRFLDAQSTHQSLIDLVIMRRSSPELHPRNRQIRTVSFWLLLYDCSWNFCIWL